MSNQYETVFIMTPVLSEEQMRETVNKYHTLIQEKGAEIVHQDHWGLRKLAYPIQKKSTGFYHLVEYKSQNGELIKDIEIAFKRDEKILRFLTIRLDKHGVAYTEKRRRLKAEAAQK